MNIKRMEAYNFLGIGSAIIEFDSISGLTLIEGENCDSATAASNGAGKSSIFEAIYWCVYGSTKRGLSGNDVINTSAKKDCCVHLYFDSYLIKRGRKDDYLYFIKIHDDGTSIDLTKGTAKETQALIESVVGMSDLTFSKVAHFGQGDIKDFASLTDAELKQVFEQSLGLGFFSDKLAKLKERRMDAARAVSDAQADIQRIGNEIEYGLDGIRFIDESIAKRDVVIRENKIHADELRTSLEAKKTLALEKAKEIAKKEAECETASQYMKELELARDDVKRELELAKDRHRTVEFTIKQLTKCISDGMSELNNIPKECDKCKRPFDGESLSSAANSIAKKIRDNKIGLEKEKAILEHTLKDKNELEAKFESLSAKLKELSSTQSTLAALNVERAFAGSLTGELRDIVNRITFIDSQNMTLESSNKEEQVKKADLEVKVKSLKSNFAGTTLKLDELEVELEDAKMLEEILGNGGLKSYIFDNITPELNKVVAEYMNILNPSISIEISTMSKLKSGEYRDKFSINIDDGNGVRSYKGFSGGEKQIVNLAIALGFNTICRLMTKNGVNILFLDEPFESLDDAASERAVELCKQFSKGIEKPFIISHSPAVRDVISSKIVVTRKGGSAKISC